jgi:hypothetical protein
MTAAPTPPGGALAVPEIENFSPLVNGGVLL